MKPIGAQELVTAAHAHIERTMSFGPRPIDHIIESLHCDSGEFQACIQVLVEEREISATERGIWAAGAVDGFVLGVRAARLAEGVA